MLVKICSCLLLIPLEPQPIAGMLDVHNLQRIYDVYARQEVLQATDILTLRNRLAGKFATEPVSYLVIHGNLTVRPCSLAATLG